MKRLVIGMDPGYASGATAGRAPDGTMLVDSLPKPAPSLSTRSRIIIAEDWFVTMLQEWDDGSDGKVLAIEEQAKAAFGKSRDGDSGWSASGANTVAEGVACWARHAGWLVRWVTPIQWRLAMGAAKSATKKQAWAACLRASPRLAAIDRGLNEHERDAIMIQIAGSRNVDLWVLENGERR